MTEEYPLELRLLAQQLYLRGTRTEQLGQEALRQWNERVPPERRLAAPPDYGVVRGWIRRGRWRMQRRSVRLAVEKEQAAQVRREIGDAMRANARLLALAESHVIPCFRKRSENELGEVAWKPDGSPATEPKTQEDWGHIGFGTAVGSLYGLIDRRAAHIKNAATLLGDMTPKADLVGAVQVENEQADDDT